MTRVRPGAAARAGQALGRTAFALAVLLAARGSAADPPRFERLSVRDGLSDNSVYCLLQDRRGFLWVGTSGGLNRWDGHVFRYYGPDSSTGAAGRAWSVTALAEAPNGALWIATLQGGVSRLDPLTDRIVSYPPEDAARHGLRAAKAYSLLIDHLGVLWVGTSGGLCRYEPVAGRFVCLTHDPSDAGSLSNDKALSIAEDREGRLWVGTVAGGLCRLDLERRRFKRYSAGVGGLGSDWVSALLVDSSGAVWAGTKGGGLARWDPIADRFRVFRNDVHDPHSLASDRIWSLHEAPLQPGVIWIGTYGGGLCRLAFGASTFDCVTRDPADAGSLPDSDVSAIRQDRGGVLWVGTWVGGLARLDLAAKPFRHYSAEPARAGSLNNDSIFGLAEDGHGTLWVATEAGVCAGVADAEGGRRFRCLRSSASDPRTLSGDHTQEVFIDRKGAVWVGTNGGGLNRIDPRSGRVRRYPLAGPSGAGPPADVVFSLGQAPDGRLLIGTEARGLLLLDPETGRVRHPWSPTGRPSDLDAALVMAIQKLSDGALWLSTSEHAVYRWRGERLDRLDVDAEGRPLGDVVIAHEDASGAVWLATTTGLLRFDPRTGSTRRWGEAEGLPRGGVGCILGDGAGGLWLSTGRGLAKLDTSTGRVRRYGEADGVVDLEFNMRACAATHDGELFFGSAEGLTAFRPEAIRDSPFRPPVALTSVRLGNRELALERAAPALERLEIPWNRPPLALDFAALAFAHSERNRYAYRIAERGAEWVDLGSDRTLNLPGLGPGRYRLEVRGATHDGVWSEQPAVLELVVRPPLWRRAWFLALAAIAFAAVSYSLIRAVRHYLNLVAFWRTRSYVGHYRLIEVLGSGGMGVVHKAVDVLDRSRPIALKVLLEEHSQDAAVRRRFLNEAALVDQLDHPNIVRVIERGEAGGRLFMAMELLEGQTLGALIARGERIPPADEIRIMAQLAGVVAAIHARSIVHRDLKPDNVMLVRAEDGLRVKLLDFGLARAPNLTRLTETGMIVGSINYLAPEQISERQYTPASDVYSLGVTFYELVTLVKPFLGDTAVDVIRQILEKRPLPTRSFRPDLPPDLDLLIASMLEKQPASRPETSAVASELERIRERAEAATIAQRITSAPV